MKIIGVAGGSGSGKTHLARTILREKEDFGIQSISMDSYYHCRKNYSTEQKKAINYDHPDAIDSELLHSHVVSLKKGLPIQAPKYCFVTHTREGETETITPSNILIIEGILALHFTQIRDLMNVRIFVEYPDSERLKRRLQRDFTQRGRSKEDVIRQWEETVLPMHKKFVQPSKDFATHEVSGEADFNTYVRALF